MYLNSHQSHGKAQTHVIILRLLKLVNIASLTALFGLCWYAVYAEQMVKPFYRRGNWVVIAIFLLLYVLLGRVYDAFSIGSNKKSDTILSQALAFLLADGISYLVISLLLLRIAPILPMVLLVAAQLVVSALWCGLVNVWYLHTFPPRPTAILYDQREGMEAMFHRYGLGHKFRLVHIQHVEVALAEGLWFLDEIDAIFLFGIHSTQRNQIIKRCVEAGVSAYVIPRIGDLIMSSARPVHLFHLPLLRVDRYSPPLEFLLPKRIFDVVSSALGLVVCSPIFLVTAIAIKATDGGPVFYRQCRLTRDGKTFDVLKFRSMRVDAEKDGVARLSSGDRDDRITPVGRFIRKCRIDELPQLINILKGEMSVVGPRPERPEIAMQYHETLPEFALRLQAKAGLTGYAQVYGKYNTTPYDKLQMDLMYIANPSLLVDLKIILATIKILFRSDSTEGVEQGQVTAMKK